jgi:hypothetical protein
VRSAEHARDVGHLHHSLHALQLQPAWACLLRTVYCALGPQAAPPATFLGRIASQLLRLSDPGHTSYQQSSCSWIDASGSETLSLAAFRCSAAGFWHGSTAC